MQIKRRQFLHGTAAVAVLGAVGTRPAFAQGGPIRIGLMLPMSGIGAEAGAAWLAGAKVAVGQWNEKGGVLKRQVLSDLADLTQLKAQDLADLWGQATSREAPRSSHSGYSGHPGAGSAPARQAPAA